VQAKTPWVFTLFTNEPGLAQAADVAGVDRIGVDLEFVGKGERQKGLGTRISSHSIDDAQAIFPLVKKVSRFARVNPINPGSKAEIDAILAAGAQVLMLPYFRTLEEVHTFSELVGGRALTVALVETLGAVAIIEDLIDSGLVSELHFGLTDLGLEMGKNHPGVLKDERFLRAVETVRRSGIPFGIAGFARPGDVSLPFDPATFVRDVVALGASRALISRSFLRVGDELSHLKGDIAALRAFVAGLGDHVG
jgi:hypothetical protein